jgi:hypothetical protein
MKLRNLLIAAAGLTVAVSAAGAASALTPWEAHHGRRLEVNHRLVEESREINRDQRDGRINAWQATHLRHHVMMIRGQERYYARHDGTHLTRWEQHRLNREENDLRHHI